MVAEPKTRLELAKLLRDRNSDPQVAGDEIVRVYQLSNDKRNSVLSLFSRISDNLKKSKRSVVHVTGDWWNVEIPWTTAIKKSRPSLLPDTVSFASDIKLEPNIERRKPLDELQMRSKKIRLDQTGILSSIRQLAILEQISIVRYVALLLYIVAMEEIGFKNIANIAWKIYTNEISNQLLP